MSTVLLVDDSATDRTIISGLLKKNGFTVRLAENGLGAVKQLAGKLPDIVLTDMQMPKMDGLELVKAVRKNYPDVPVILMTGHGSEALAAEALRNGAASYVPKAQMKELLVDSVRHVLDLAKSDASYQRLIDHTKVTDFHFELKNEAELVEPLVTLVQQMMNGMGVCDSTGCLQVGVALEQAVLNAMYHGNLELSSEELRADHELVNSVAASGASGDAAQPLETSVQNRLRESTYAERRVFVRALVSREQAKFTVRDEGPGFDVRSKLDVSLSDDESAGRGLVLMWALMDKVGYNKIGNEVTLIKNRANLAEAEQADEASTNATPDAKTGSEVVPPQKLGELVPLDGGPSIHLSQPRLSVGRDPECDVVVPHTDVSHEHCLLYMFSGWWYVKDLKSANGTRLNKKLIDQKRIAPGATLAIATHQFEVRYSPWDLGAEGITPPVDPF